MITNKDRSGWIGASDTSFVVGNWSTETFKKWWATKLGVTTNDISTKAMKVGNAYEHKILDAIGVNGRDKQIIVPELKLRVNLDGNSKDTIYEVKTHKNEFKVTKQYWRQAQVEMFAWLRSTGELPKLFIVAYRTTEEDYANYFREIEKDRLSFHEITYDTGFINNDYLPKLEYLKECLKEGRMPRG